MTYNPNIPAANDIISVSQGDILTNFGQLNAIFDEDHVTFNAASNNGKHNKSTYVESPDPVTIANEVAIYSKDDGAGNTRLFFAPETAGAVYQWSNRNPTVGAANPGESWLPGGFLIKWGTNAIGAGNTVISFGTAFPTAVLSVITTVQKAAPFTNADTDHYIQDPYGVGSFTVHNSTAASFTLNWIAIGY